MGAFGWSLPPGCGRTPEEEAADNIHPSSEELYALLEGAGVEQSVIDKATKIIDDLVVEYETRLAEFYDESEA